MQKNHKYKTKLNHLSHEELESLKSEYYSGENTKGLTLKYNIDVAPSSLFRTFPLVRTENIKCKYCKIAMYFIPPVKTNRNRKEYICTSCQHKESILGCRCKKCLYQKAINKEDTRKKKSLQSKKNKETILTTREYPNAPILSMINIKERLYLGALLRTHLHHDCLLIDLNNNSAQSYAPTAEYRDNILIELLEKNIIAPYRINKNESAEILEKYMQGELYDICISDIDRNKRELIEELMYPDNSSLSYLYRDIHILQEEIQINEAIEYMMLIIKKFDFYTFDIQEKYRILFSQILKQYSLGQLFNFIYTAIRNQAAYSKKECHQGYIPIANYIYKSISNRYEKAQDKDWNITSYNRIYEAEETELSKLIKGVLQD